jgi:maltooligosyltrehalose trehalohydrolase
MHRFEVWAPLAKHLQVDLETALLPMHGPDANGWWHLDVADAGPGTDYAYRIDNDSLAYPDPRSQWQPNGVHAPSRIYDQNAFAWSDAGFEVPVLADGILYELHIGTFTTEGTLDAAISKLDYLAQLGVTHVELMPVASFPGDRGWGYDGVALFAVHETYGGPDALKRFVDAAHGRGLAVLLDVVYNHFGPLGNYTGKYGPYLVNAHQTPWGGAVNLEDAGSREVRRFFCDNAILWLSDFRLDGLRLDAVHAFIDRSAIHFLEQLSSEVEALAVKQDRKLVLIAESDLNDPRTVTSRERGGWGMDAQWSDDFHHALFAVLNQAQPQGYYADFGTLEQLAKALEKTFVYDGIFSRYRDRIHGKPAAGLPQNRFVGFIQNHDQVGNRAIGDRLVETVGFERAKIAAAVVAIGPFVPLLFQGEEWAASSPFQYFADHDDAKMALAVSEGRKREFREFGWQPESIPDPEAQSTFENSKLNWEEMGNGNHSEMLSWYRALIQLRKAEPSLHGSRPGQTRTAFSESDKWFLIERGDVTLICNLGSAVRALPAPSHKRVLLTSRAGVTLVDHEITLPADSAVILK